MKRLRAWWPEILLGLCVLWLFAGFRPAKLSGPFDANAFGQLPVLSGGRLKPLDTVSRTSLLLLRGKQTVRVEDKKLTANEWLLDMFFRAETADRYKVFAIDHPDVLGLMGLEQTKERYFSFGEIHPHLTAIEEQVTQVQPIKQEQRTRYQRAVAALGSQIILYQRLQNTMQIAGADKVAAEHARFANDLRPLGIRHARGGRISDAELKEVANALRRYQFMSEASQIFSIPEKTTSIEWMSVGQAALRTLQGTPLNPGVLAYGVVGDSYRAGDAGAFNRAVAEYASWLKTLVPDGMTRTHAEAMFNAFEPFYKAMIIDVLVFVFASFFWMTGRPALRRSAWQLLVLAFVVHTSGLLARMILQGRPPVTNLYSSAIFVGWAAVGLGLILERWYKNAVGTAVAAIIGFLTLIIAHHLSSQGDTLEMMRAVLDSNFWLATHVVCITLGYSATFLTGFLAATYLLRRWLQRGWENAAAKSLAKMVFGSMCFAIFFSFLGTVLGGIWADQSWGRFWGWDPKENGALMIVLWNAFVLHARVGRVVGDRGTMVFAVFGNVVTAFSWFGVNMLGIGLHSYGFMDKAFSWLVLFSLSQIAIMAAGFIPESKTRRSRSA
jgi:ABC-type transport system involved in cytochrome c biogenesis permease subunit